MSSVNAQIPNQEIQVMLVSPKDLPGIVTTIKQGKVMVVFEHGLKAKQRAALHDELSRDYAQGRNSGYFIIGSTDYFAAYVNPLPSSAAGASATTATPPTISAQSQKTVSAGSTKQSVRAAKPTAGTKPTTAAKLTATTSAQSTAAASAPAKPKTRACTHGRRHHLPTKVDRAANKARYFVHSVISLKQN